MSRLDFIPARLPEAISMKPGGYVIIKPPKPSSATSRDESSDDDGDSINESDASESSILSDSSESSTETGRADRSGVIWNGQSSSSGTDETDLSGSEESVVKAKTSARKDKSGIHPDTPDSAKISSSPDAESSSSSDTSSSPSSSSSSQSASSSRSSSPSTSSSQPSPEVKFTSGSPSESESESESGQSSSSSPSPLVSSAELTGVESADASSMSSPGTRLFYSINENPKDQGTRTPPRIFKSWQASASAPVGLENRGVTCYVNAAVESLFHLPAFGRYMQQIVRGKVPFKRGSISLELAQLFKRVTEDARGKTKSYVYPSKLLRRLEDINPMLSEFEQQDSHEFFISLISKLQDESVPKGQKLRTSIIHDMFGGTLQQAVTCSRCNHVSETDQDFYDLPVYFGGEKPHTLIRAIQGFFSPEAIKPVGANTGYQCDNCHKTTRAVKKSLIKEAPEYLTVHMMRFKFEAASSHKVKDPMAYPLELSLSPYSIANDPLHYKLIAVVVHEGRTVSSGHYIAFCLQPSNEWAMYDDEEWRTVPESFVRKQRDAYMLIYSKLTPKSTTATSQKSTNTVNSTKKTKSSVSNPQLSKSHRTIVKPPLALPLAYNGTAPVSGAVASPKKKKRSGWPLPIPLSSSPNKKRASIGDEIDNIFRTKRSKR